MVWFMGGTIVLVGAMMVAVPLLSRRTVPLGVSVPSGRLGDPAVGRAILGYQLTCIALTIVATLGVVVTIERHPGSIVAWLMVLIVGCGASFALWRRGIITAKAVGHWYDGQPVRISASGTADVPEVRAYWWLHIASFLIAAAATAVIVAQYDKLPDPYPTHWGIDGTPDAFAPKSLLVVGSVPLIGIGMACFMAVIAVVIARRREALLPDGDPDGARVASTIVRNKVLLTLGVSSLIMNATFGFLGVVPLLHVTPLILNVATVALLLASVLVPLAIVIGAARARARVGQGDAHGPESPDDDALWKWGMFYVNRDDPSVLVPKRAGVGYDLNFGRPAGMVFGVLAALLVVAGVVLPFVVA